MPRRIKRAAIQTPKNTDELGDWIEEIGQHQRSLANIENAMNAAIAEVRAQHEQAAKTVRLRSGEALWRNRPDSVSIRDAEAVLEHLEAEGLQELDRAREVPGVTIGSQEDFVIVPSETKLEQLR